MTPGLPFRYLAIVLAAFLGASCSEGKAPAAETPRPRLQTVRLGKTPDDMLLTICTPGEFRTCTVTLVDKGRNGDIGRVEYLAPAGRSISDAVFADDAILAVLTQAPQDAQGNRRSAIVSFPRAGDGTVTVRQRASVEMNYPVEFGGRLLFWQRDCRSPKERYCQHDVFSAVADAPPVRVGKDYRFATIGRIVPRDGATLVNANVPADAVFDANFLEWGGGNHAWRMAPRQPYGLAKIASALSVIFIAPAPDGLLLLADDGKGIALFRQTARGISRLADLPPATASWPGTNVLDLDISEDGRGVAMVIGNPDSEDGPQLFMLDVASARWRTVTPAEYRATRRIMLKEKVNA